MNNGDDSAAVAAIARLVELSSRYAWLVILGFLLVAIASASYFTAHFVITSDTNKLISSSLPWRQQEVMLDLAFPHRVDQIVTVIEATTPEAAASAADALVNELSPRSDVIRTISQLEGSEFFERNGILFRSLDEVRRDTSDLISAQPFLGTLAVDPTLRGVFRTLSQSLEGVRLGKAKLDDLKSGARCDRRCAGSPGEREDRRVLLAHADHRPGGGALGASSLCGHPAGSALRRSAAGRPGNGTHT